MLFPIQNYLQGYTPMAFVAVLTWLKNFFSSRMHQTKVGTASSDTAMLCSGVV